MNPIPADTKRWTAALAIIYAVLGITPMAGLGCSEPFIWDTEALEWRPATPDDLNEVTENLAQPIKDVLHATPGAVAIPWIDMATRLLAVLVALRWSKPHRATPPRPSPPQEPNR